MTATTGNSPDIAPAGTLAPAAVHTLVVAHDGSVLSSTALATAARLGARLGAEIELLSVVPRRLDVDARRAELAAGGLPGPGAAGPGIAVVQAADAVDALLDALAGRPDVVGCIASHGAGRSCAAVGSVARDVLARARGPVVVAPALVDAVAGQGVVACVDGGPASPAVLALAAGWARLLDDDATAVTVTGTVPRAPGTGDPWAGPAEAEAGLGALCAQARAHGHRLASLTLRDPAGAASGLCRHLRSRPARLVVLSARSHAGLPWLPLGRQAAGILRHSPAPVLVVPGRAVS